MRPAWKTHQKNWPVNSRKLSCDGWLSYCLCLLRPWYPPTISKQATICHSVNQRKAVMIRIQQLLRQRCSSKTCTLTNTAQQRREYTSPTLRNYKHYPLFLLHVHRVIWCKGQTELGSQQQLRDASLSISCLAGPLFLGVVVSHLFCFDSSTFHSISLLSRGTCVFSIKLTEEN